MQANIELLLRGDYRFLAGEILPPESIDLLFEKISKNGDVFHILKRMIIHILSSNIFTEWNCSNLIAKVDSEVLASVISSIDDVRIYNSEGLTWAVGELHSRDETLVNYLHKTVQLSNNDKSWWNAAFSLEHLGLEKAIPLLKSAIKKESIKSVEECLDDLSNRKSVISLLIQANIDTTKNVIYKFILNYFTNIDIKKIANEEIDRLLNIIWLVGRFNFKNELIISKIIQALALDNEKLTYICLSTLGTIEDESLVEIFRLGLKNKNVLYRKLSARYLSRLMKGKSLLDLQAALKLETNLDVIGELTRAIYLITDYSQGELEMIHSAIYLKENGSISDESDKWYGNPSYYNIFSEAEDPQGVCYELIFNKLAGLKIDNPIDIASGTGKTAWNILRKIKFTGAMHCLDASPQMCGYLENRERREARYENKIKIHCSSIDILDSALKGTKSSLVISSFGFPSRISDTELIKRELEAVYNVLKDGGIFVTIGWDETFLDELNEMWYRFVPDKIRARSYEEWRKIRTQSIVSPRNCNLTWFKKGLLLPLRFKSLNESALVMGDLFGRDAAEYVLENNKMSWMMSLGITWNTKAEIKQILNRLKRAGD